MAERSYVEALDSWRGVSSFCACMCIDRYVAQEAEAVAMAIAMVGVGWQSEIRLRRGEANEVGEEQVDIKW